MITEALVTRAVAEIKKGGASYRYFFQHLASAEWLEPLHQHGFFQNPPSAELNARGGISFPFWQESACLRRLAETGKGHESILHIIRSLPTTDNERVQSDVIETLRALPPSMASAMEAQVQNWASSRHLFLIPEPTSYLIGHFAAGGYADVAHRLARTLYSVFPSEPSVSRFVAEAGARFDSWLYDKTLSEQLPVLTRTDPRGTLDLLSGLLSHALGASQPSDCPEDYSYIWRPRLEKASTRTVRDVLVNALRRTASELAQAPEHAPVVVASLHASRWTIFRRIRIELLAAHPELTQDIVADLTDRKLLWSYGAMQEYCALLTSSFSRLSSADKALVLAAIVSDPPMKEGTEADAEGVEIMETWQLQKLHCIAGFLAGEHAARHASLLAKYKHVPRTAFSEVETRSYGLQSPRSLEELQSLDTESLLRFLETWFPEEHGHEHPSRAGLGRVLAALVEIEATRFSRDAGCFERSGIDPTYIRSFMDGLAAAVARGHDIDWAAALDLVIWTISQPAPAAQAKGPSDMIAGDSDWSWARTSSLKLLTKGLERESDTSGAEIPIKLRTQVWSAIQVLSEDPDPTKEREKGAGGFMAEPLSLSINSIRGNALHAALYYVYWIRRHATSTEAQPMQHDVPEVAGLLERHLNIVTDPSLAVRAVYGQWLPSLVHLDKDWVHSNLDTILPEDAEHSDYWRGAWNTYLVYARPSRRAFPVLRAKYVHAVKALRPGEIESYHNRAPEMPLAEHLMTYYWWGDLALESELLVSFFERAPSAVRRHAIEFVGRSLREAEEVGGDVLNRLRELWRLRMAAHERKDYPGSHEELLDFGSWLVSDKFERGWALGESQRVLTVASTIEPLEPVVEHLLKTVEEFPGQSVAILDQLARVESSWELLRMQTPAREVLGRAIRHPDAAVREAAEETVHKWGARGWDNLRDLLNWLP